MHATYDVKIILALFLEHLLPNLEYRLTWFGEDYIRNCEEITLLHLVIVACYKMVSLLLKDKK